MDDIQAMLICLVMLFSSDGMELNDRETVSQIQSKYAAMLYRYLKTKYRGDHRSSSVALAKFGQGMMVSSMSREMREIFVKQSNY